MGKEFSFSGKRFLINQPMIRSFCGSTMVTLELATYLLSKGAEVTVYTNIALEPALSYFKKFGIKILTPEDDNKIFLEGYDYVWVHSLTFPRSLLEELKSRPKKMPAFIFLHMSPLDSIPDEHPWIYNIENYLSSLSLYISEKTLESNKKFGLPSNVGYFRNPAPMEFEDLAKRKKSDKIRNILVVSNHPPKEIIEAKKYLEKVGISVDIFGDGQDKYQPVSPDDLKKYDAVITIGKTAQYCIVGSTPVYIYDWFGGPGWLTNSNYKHAKSNNFSGRFSNKKTGEEIACEVMEGYGDALKFCIDFLNKHKDEYLIDHVLEGIFKNLKPRKIKPMSDKYIESVKAAVYCAEIRFVASEELGSLYKRYDDLVKQTNEYKGLYFKYKNDYDSIINSKRHKILNTLFKPYDSIKSSLRNEQRDKDI